MKYRELILVLLKRMPVRVRAMVALPIVLSLYFVALVAGLMAAWTALLEETAEQSEQINETLCQVVKSLLTGKEQ